MREDQMYALSQRAVAGAEFLDSREPGWAAHIDLARLDMGCKHNCVLGQLAGSYERGLEKFGLRDGLESRIDQRVLFFGLCCFEFLISRRQRAIQYLLLTDAWKQAVRERCAV